MSGTMHIFFNHNRYISAIMRLISYDVDINKTLLKLPMIDHDSKILKGNQSKCRDKNFKLPFISNIVKPYIFRIQPDTYNYMSYQNQSKSTGIFIRNLKH